jgi:hypothetical protein
MSASRGGHMEIVKYLCEVGGKKLLMRADKVSGRMHVLMRGCRHVCMPICSQACFHAQRTA